MLRTYRETSLGHQTSEIATDQEGLIEHFMTPVNPHNLGHALHTGKAAKYSREY